jgi:hypothetical protein
MISIFFDKIYSNKLLYNLFSLWLFTIPFGSSIVKFSLDGFTLYPSLVFLILLMPSFFISYKRFSKFQWYFFFLLTLLTLHSVVYYPFVEGREDGLFDVRSILLFQGYYIVLLSSFYFFGKSKWKFLLSNGLRFYLYLLLIFGGIESLFGIHIAGDFTYKLSQSLVVNHYTPIFLFDNPNDYIVYTIGLTISLLLIDKTFLNNTLFLVLILSIQLFYAHMALSRLGILLLSGLLIIILVNYIRKSTYPFSKHIKVYFFLFISILLLLTTKPIYLGPILTTFLEENKDVSDKKSLKIYDKITSDSDSITRIFENNIYLSTQSKLDSYQVRRNLFLNGIEIYRTSPIIGVGPGQFKYLIKTNKDEYLPVDNNYSPHNFFTELTCNYGALGIIFIISFIYILCVSILKKIKQWKWLLIFLIIYLVLAVIPSGFLYLNINWLMLSILWIVFTENYNKHKQNAYTH